MLLSIKVNSLKKAKRIAESRKGFYEKFYVDYNLKVTYVVFYRPIK